jgi:hypothetical protein
MKSRNPYICKKCGTNPLVHESDRLNGVCEGCKLKKLQAKRRREYRQQLKSGTKYSGKTLSKEQLQANIERVVRKAKQTEQAGRAADVFNISPRSLKIQVRGAQKVG